MRWLDQGSSLHQILAARADALLSLRSYLAHPAVFSGLLGLAASAGTSWPQPDPKLGEDLLRQITDKVLAAIRNPPLSLSGGAPRQLARPPI